MTATTTQSWEVGQQVMIHNPGRPSHGMLGTITSEQRSGADGPIMDVALQDGRTRGIYVSRFRRVDSNLAFQVGDRVVLLTNHAGLLQGSCGAVESVGEDGTVTVSWDPTHRYTGATQTTATGTYAGNLFGITVPDREVAREYLRQERDYPEGAVMRLMAATSTEAEARGAANSDINRYQREGRSPFADFQRWTNTGAGNPERDHVVCFPDELGYDTTLFMGNVDPVFVSAAQMALTLGTQDPIPVGERVRYGGRKGTIVSKSDGRVEAYYRRDRAIQRSGDYAAFLRDGSTTAQIVGARECIPLVDVGDLTPEQQIERLQRLVHRVASYEASRRNWCDEVNGALAYLDLPEPYDKVDRGLGQRLQRNPRLIFAEDKMVPHSVTIEGLSYPTTSGFSIADARVTVHDVMVTTLAESAADVHVHQDAIRQAVIADADLLTPSDEAHFDFRVTSFTPEPVEAPVEA